MLFEGWSDGVNLYPAGAAYRLKYQDVEFTAQWAQDISEPGESEIPSQSPAQTMKPEKTAEVSSEPEVSASSVPTNVPASESPNPTGNSLPTAQPMGNVSSGSSTP